MDKLQLIKMYISTTGNKMNEVIQLSLILLAEFWLSSRIINQSEYNEIISEIALGRVPTLDELINNAIYSARESEYIELWMIESFCSDCLYYGRITRTEYENYISSLMA